ncbi:MAG: MarR family winged helix-turn-helix transcriptional regulator [Dehalococcoidia bacterium]
MVDGSPDRPDDLAGKVVAALDRVARSQRSRRQSVAVRHGITPLQADLLLTLSLGEPPAPAVGLLARELGVSQPTVTDSLHALERKQLVVRHRHPADARRASFVLTPIGSQLVAELAAAEHELVETVAELARPEQEAMLEYTLDLIARLAERGFITVARTCFTCRYHEHDGAGHRCALLDMTIGPADLRVNCPEHELAVSA